MEFPHHLIVDGCLFHGHKTGSSGDLLQTWGADSSTPVWRLSHWLINTGLCMLMLRFDDIEITNQYKETGCGWIGVFFMAPMDRFLVAIAMSFSSRASYTAVIPNFALPRIDTSIFQNVQNVHDMKHCNR